MTPLSKSMQQMPKIGDGIYAAHDVAEILKLDYHKVKYLMNGFWKTYTVGKERNKVINFLSLIEFYIYYYLRKENFTPSFIKKLHAKLEKDFGTPYPFAALKINTHKVEKEKETLVEKNKGEIWLDFKGYLIQANGKLQPSIRTFVEPFLKQIEYEDDFLARRFYPLINSNKSKNIVVDPKRSFGQPIVNKKGVRTEVINNFIRGGEKKETICKLYELTPEEVEDVILYYHERAA